MAKQGAKKGKKKWIQDIDMKEGALTRKAKGAGMTVDEFARKHLHDSGETGRQARLYWHVLKPAAKKRKKGKGD